MFPGRTSRSQASPRESQAESPPALTRSGSVPVPVAEGAGGASPAHASAGHTPEETARKSFSLKHLRPSKGDEEGAEAPRPKSPRSLFSRSSDDEHRSLSPRTHVRSHSLFRPRKTTLGDASPPPPSLTALPSDMHKSSGSASGSRIGRRDRFATQRRSRSMSNMLDVAGMGEDDSGPGLLGSSLDELLDHDFGEEDGDDDHRVPRVLVHLIGQVERTNGFETEGIFRLSIATSVKNAALARLHSGVLDSTSKDPHLYCVLLKEWLRRLPEPLVPSYEKCIRLAEEEDVDAQEALLEEIWADTSIPAKAVLQKLVDFIEAACLHEKVTRMNASSLCLVFAPGILRPAKEQSALDMLRDQPLSQRALLRIYEWIVELRKKEVAEEAVSSMIY